MFGRWASRTLIGIVVLCAFVPAAFGEEGTPLDKELDKVWGKERGISVIEKRAFEKDQRHEIGLLFGAIPTDPFFNYITIGLRYDFFILESVAIELAGAYVHPFDSGLRDDLVKKSGGAFTDQTNPSERVKWYAGVNAYWAPIHGKFEIFASKIATFDVGLLLGLGIIGSEYHKGGLDAEWTTRKSYGSVPFNVMGNIGLGCHFVLTDYLALRVDYRHYLFPRYPGANSNEWTNGVAHFGEFTVGLGYFTPAPK